MLACHLQGEGEKGTYHCLLFQLHVNLCHLESDVMLISIE